MINELKVLEEEVRKVADAMGSVNAQVELSRKFDQNQKQIADNDNWRLHFPSWPDKRLEISEPLAMALQTWGWDWGFRKSIKVALRILDPKTHNARFNMCECGHWKGNHHDVEPGSTERVCYGKSCKCEGFKSARI